MMTKGIFEELMVADKDYPVQQITHRLRPKEYTEALVHYAAREMGEKFRQMSDAEQFDDIVDLTQRIIGLMRSETAVSLAMPLSTIRYSYDQREIPIGEDLFLSRMDLITNDRGTMKNFLKTLNFELETSDSADFMVSFIRWSGVQLLLRRLSDMESENKKVRILTSVYMNITQPQALRKLMELSNVEVRIFDSGKESFHTKAYLFHRKSGLNTAIIGSSNLSQAALDSGYEWNVKIPDASYLPIYELAHQRFETLWQDERAVPVTNELIERYGNFLKEHQKQKKKPIPKFYLKEERFEQRTGQEPVENVTPNRMQQKALAALQETREKGHDKGVVIAATGSGKTYLSAFDVKAAQVDRLLFLAHREELLDSAMRTFENVFETKSLCGKLTGTTKEWDKKYLFSTVQTLHREENLHRFPSDYFDYIIVDEFHHASADTYLKVMEHFRPKFLLGLTATPERMDGQDVLDLCDRNIVYEIRLRDALDADLLVPFHYFGLKDDTVNYEEIPENNEQVLVRKLSTEKRVDYVIEMIKKYEYDGDRLYGLGFCASVEHAKYMSEEFNKKGYHTAYVTGSDTQARRAEIISRLEDERDPLELIFTVDIFNEGIDIPKLNLVLFLRPTESSTIFIQQLGRGLRKTKGKEFVTILDFIGNYQKSFIVPLAFSNQSGRNSLDPETIKAQVRSEYADLPPGSNVDLDTVTKKHILDKLDKIRLNSNKVLKDFYFEFRKLLGRSPEIQDFLYTEEAPSLVYFLHKYKSWVKTKDIMNDANEFDKWVLANSDLVRSLERIEKLLPIKWPYEFALLELTLEQKEIAIEDVLYRLVYRFSMEIQGEYHDRLIYRAMNNLATIVRDISFGKVEGNSFVVDPAYQEMIKDIRVKEYLSERINYGLVEFRRTFKPELFLKGERRLVLYQNYTRNEIRDLHDVNSPWREGVARAGNQYFLFINLNKDKNVSEHLHYKDYFIDPTLFHWQSQNQTSRESGRGQDFFHHKEKGIHIHLFVRKYEKMHDMTLPFMYLGEVDFVSWDGDKPISIKWKLHDAVPEDLYFDLVR